MVIPPILAIILPILAAPAATYLGKDKWPQWVNALIACAIVLAAAISWGFFANALTNNVGDDILLIVAYVGVLMASPLKPLYAVLFDQPVISAPTSPASSSPSSAQTAEAVLDAVDEAISARTAPASMVSRDTKPMVIGSPEIPAVSSSITPVATIETNEDQVATAKLTAVKIDPPSASSL